jgi:hypothetical protein
MGKIKEIPLSAEPTHILESGYKHGRGIFCANATLPSC